MGGIATAAIIGGGLSMIGSIFGASSASKRARAAAREKARLEAKMDVLEKNRQAIINPYAGVTNISGMAKDLSSMASNPYANLGVATQAAEMQVEEADIALANTLDTLRATGSGAGGATALAQAALQSKKGVAANIEQQEVANEKARAQGEEKLNQIKMSEAQRMQNIEMSEAQRMQQADVAGQSFVFGQKESRETQQLNRVASQISGAQQQQVAAQQAQSQFLSSGLSAIGTIGSAFGTGGGASTPTTGSDRRLKQNIKLIGVSPKGLNIYSFEYIDKVFGEGTWQGVMSDEIPQDAVIKHKDGYDKVDYSKLDVTFKQI